MSLDIKSSYDTYETNIYISIWQVFIPINIRELHWYLVVLNAKRRDMQVLDSLGSSLGHKDLDCVVSK
jgi:Ulp1 family protease